ncbi:MAG: 5'(3')-deoxyribonucleotidase [Bacteroidota bacterium]
MKRILIDMDEVMADAYGKFIQHYTEEFGTIPPERYRGKKIYDLPEAQHMRDYLYRPNWFADLAVMPDAVQVIAALQAQYEIFIVTAAQEFRNCLADKHAWLSEHFPFIPWRNYVMCGDKSVVTGDYMIDDKASNLAKFSGKGLLFTAPHNVFEEKYTRVNNWQDVAKFFQEEANKVL